jgi:hypothetical protein
MVEDGEWKMENGRWRMEDRIIRSILDPLSVVVFIILIVADNDIARA